MIKSEFGSKSFPVWLLSEMEVSLWDQKLEGPFDYRLPMRHVIATSVFNKIQETVFRLDKRRVDTDKFYIRSILPSQLNKPNINDVVWENAIKAELESIKKDIDKHHPKIILTYGAFAYESLRRIKNMSSDRSYGSWTPAEMGDAFREHVKNFEIKNANFFPFLDRSISGWRFLESHDEFVGSENADYYSYVGQEIGKLLIKHKDEIKVWV